MKCGWLLCCRGGCCSLHAPDFATYLTADFIIHQLSCHAPRRPTFSVSCDTQVSQQLRQSEGKITRCIMPWQQKTLKRQHLLAAGTADIQLYTGTPYASRDLSNTQGCKVCVDCVEFKGTFRFMKNTLSFCKDCWGILIPVYLLSSHMKHSGFPVRYRGL